MKQIALILSALLLAACASTPPVEETNSSSTETTETDVDNRAAFESFCASAIQPPCRKDVAFTLMLDEKGNEKSFDFDLLPPPVGNDGSVSILPGETLYVSGNFIGGKLVLPLVSYEPPPKVDYLKFTLRQQPGKTDMLLSVENTFDTLVKYRIVMMGPEDDQLYKTSSCPVMANGGAYEHWPHAIFQLMVIEVRAMEAGEGMVCEW